MDQHHYILISKLFGLILDKVFLNNPTSSSNEYIQNIIELLKKYNIYDKKLIDQYLNLIIDNVKNDGNRTINNTIELTLHRLWFDYCKSQNKFYFEILSGNGCGLTMGSLINYCYNYNKQCFLGPIKFGGFNDPKWISTMSMSKISKNNKFSHQHNYLFEELEYIDNLLENVLIIFTKFKELGCNLFTTNYYELLENDSLNDILILMNDYIYDAKKLRTI